MFKPIFTTIWVIFLLVGISGCSGKQDEQELRFGLSRAPINLDPRFATDATSSRINRLIYQQLVDFDDAYRAVPSLASWQALSARHYRFTLIDTAQGRFISHSLPDAEKGRLKNGKKVDVLDIKATYDSILDPITASPHRGGLAMIDSIKIVSDNTIDFYLNKPDPLFPGRLVIGILPAELVAANHPFNQRPVGSGAFEFMAWPEEGVLQLKRRSDDAKLTFIEVKNPTVRVLKLLRGEIDMLQNDLPSELVGYLQEQPEISVTKGSGSNFSYLGFNMQDSTTSNLKVRQAIAYALDRSSIIHYVMRDAATRASAILPPDHWAGEQLQLYPYDPDKARQLLKEAGYGPDNRPKIVYKTSNDPFRVRLATIIQQQLNEVGIDVDLRSYDWGTFYGDIKAGRFQMFSLSWIGIKMPDIFHYVFHSESIPPEGANRGHFVDAVTDALIEKAEAGLDLDQQANAYKKLQAHLLEQLPYVPLWYEDHVFAARKGIEGYSVAHDGNYDGLIHVNRH